jgi:hypothetical protein
MGVDKDALQATLFPPLTPLQTQAHGPAPVTVDGTPEEQRLDDGAEGTVVLCADPQEPLTAVTAQSQ